MPQIRKAIEAYKHFYNEKKEIHLLDRYDHEKSENRKLSRQDSFRQVLKRETKSFTAS